MSSNCTAFILFSILIGTLALMVAAVLIFWTYYPDDSSLPNLTNGTNASQSQQ
jgi:hypothetical protein